MIKIGDFLGSDGQFLQARSHICIRMYVGVHIYTLQLNHNGAGACDLLSSHSGVACKLLTFNDRFTHAILELNYSSSKFAIITIFCVFYRYSQHFTLTDTLTSG